MKKYNLKRKLNRVIAFGLIHLFLMPNVVFSKTALKESTLAPNVQINKVAIQDLFSSLPGQKLESQVKETDIKSAITGKDGSSEKFPAFVEYCTASLGKKFHKISESELQILLPLYLSEVFNAFFAEANDFEEAYREFYNSNLSQQTRMGKIKTKFAKAYIPIIRKPFSSLKEIKSVIDTSYEWNMDFLPEPDKWKGVKRFSFILCLMADGRLQMSLYDGQGLIKKIDAEEDVESTLKNIGIIGNKGILILTKSSMDKLLRDSSVPGIGSRVSLNGHSHPKGTDVIPSQAGLIEDPADTELFFLMLTELPERFPVDRNIPVFIEELPKVTREHKSDEVTPANLQVETVNRSFTLPEEEMRGELKRYMKRLQDVAESERGKRSDIPINALVLYLKVLIAMHEELVTHWKGSVFEREGDDFVDEDRAEFAGDLAHHPNFQGGYALRLFQKTYAGVLRELARHRIGGGRHGSYGAFQDAMGIIDTLFKEASIHPKLRESLIHILNDPRTYGLGEIGLKGLPTGEDKQSKTASSFAGKIKSLIGIPEHGIIEKNPGKDKTKEIPGAKTVVVTQQGQPVVKDDPGDIFPAVSNMVGLESIIDELFAVKEKEEDTKKSKYVYIPTPKVIIGEKRYRLLWLADGCANDDPPLAEALLREYLRLADAYQEKVDFYFSVSLGDEKNIMKSRKLRPLVMKIAENIREDEGRYRMFIKIAGQRMNEGDVQGALDLLEEIRLSTNADPSFTLQQLIALLLVSKEYDRKMVEQLERIIEDIPLFEGKVDKNKIKLLVGLGDSFYSLGMKQKAGNLYEKAWKFSEGAANQAVTRLEYLVPVMREKGISFPESRTDVLEKVTRIAKNDILRNYSPNADKMILLAREYAFNKEYGAAEKCARFISDYMEFFRDPCDECYGAIMEASVLEGNYGKTAYAASKMKNGVKDHLEYAARLLIKKREYEKALDLGNKVMKPDNIDVKNAAGLLIKKREYEKALDLRNKLMKPDNSGVIVSGWEFVQARLALKILRQDDSQIELVRKYLKKGFDEKTKAVNLEDITTLFSEYPALDPDGKFMLYLFDKAAKQKNESLRQFGYRIILKVLRETILNKTREKDSSLSRISDVYEQINRTLLSPDKQDAVINGEKDIDAMLLETGTLTRSDVTIMHRQGSLLIDKAI